LGVGGRKSKREKVREKEKAHGEHQRIYIRRSIKNGGLEGNNAELGN